MKKLLTVFLCLILVFGTAGCGVQPGDQPAVSNNTNSAQSTDPVQTTPSPYRDESDTDDSAPEDRGHYTFDPKVISAFYREVYGDKMCDAWFNLVDAVMEGKDTFACADDFTYNWMTGQFPCKLLPPLEGAFYNAGDPDHPVKKGMARITYLIPHEKLIKKINEFGELVEDILNKVFRDDYSDFEKVYSLYDYFSRTYKYDYDTYYALFDHNVEGLSAYRLLTTGTGICSEIAPAYAYLLMQAGVDAGNMGGIRSYDGMGHDWAYVRINGKNYHIDPTYGLDSDCSLTYFMMTDKQRKECDGYARKNFAVLSVYSKEYGAPDYRAADDTFSVLWDCYGLSMDHEEHMLIYKYYTDTGEERTGRFNYTGY